jgi:hypothetical protein
MDAPKKNLTRIKPFMNGLFDSYQYDLIAGSIGADFDAVRRLDSGLT